MSFHRSDMKDKKTKNILTVIIILIMLASAAVAIISVKGFPKIELSGVNLDKGYDDRKEKRDDAQKSILGEWQATDNDNFVVDVWRDGEGLFHATVNYSEKEGEVYFWEMTGGWQDNEVGFIYSDCKKSRVTYDADGNPTEEVIYEEGVGSITSDGHDSITWTDKNEKMGDGITFEYIGEY